MNTTTGTIPFRTYKTWYKIFGDLANRKHRPLVVLHGGPGAGHNYLLPIGDLATTHGIPVIFYDQIGCGESTRLPHIDPSFWTINLFLEELDNLLVHFGIREDFDILGNSFGGMLAPELAVRRPPGLKHLVIGCGLARTQLWVEATLKLRAELPDNGAAIMRKHELDGTMDSPEYEKWVDLFNSRHECRVQPMPEYVAKTFQLLKEEPTSTLAMLGPTEIDLTGSLKDWTIIPRLHLINVPTLVYNGKYDVGTDICTKPFADGIPGAIWYKFQDSSHMPHVEERELHMQIVGDFLIDKK